MSKIILTQIPAQSTLELYIIIIIIIIIILVCLNVATA